MDDGGASAGTLAGVHPSGTLDRLRACLQNRWLIGAIPAAPPRRWIKNSSVWWHSTHPTSGCRSPRTCWVTTGRCTATKRCGWAATICVCCLGSQVSVPCPPHAYLLGPPPDADSPFSHLQIRRYYNNMNARADAWTDEVSRGRRSGGPSDRAVYGIMHQAFVRARQHTLLDSGRSLVHWRGGAGQWAE